MMKLSSVLLAGLLSAGLVVIPPASGQAIPPSQHQHATMTPAQSMPASTSDLELLKEVFGRPALNQKDLEDLALAKNPTLKQANAMVRRSAGLARQAGLYPNPSVGYQGEQIRGGSSHGGEQGAFVQQTIVTGGKLGLRREVFEQQRRADEIGVSEQRYRVLNELGQSYYSTLAAQETVKVRRQLLALASDAVQTVHQLANVGQADAPDILQAEVESEQAAVDYIAAQRTFIQQFLNLAVLAGEPDLPLAPLAGDLEKPPVVSEEILEQIIRESPAIKRSLQEVTRAEAELKSARRETIPDLQLRGGLQQNFESQPSGRPKGLQGFATVGIALPIFNRNQGNVEAAKADIERAKVEVMRTQLSLRHAAQPLVQNILTGQQQALRYKSQMLPRASKAYQLYLAKYQQMGAAYPQVIVSQRTLFQLQVAYIRVLEDLWRNSIALQNFTLSGGLEPPRSIGGSTTNMNLPGGAGQEQ